LSTGLRLAPQAMLFDVAARVGGVLRKQLPSGQVRWVIDLGRRAGERVRIFSIPSPVDGRPIPFTSQEFAEAVLSQIRGDLRSGRSLDDVIATYRGRPAPGDLAETRFAAYLKHWEAQVQGGQRSPTSLRDLQRYFGEKGHLGSYWRGRSVRTIKYADLERFRDWLLTEQGLSAKTAANVMGALRAALRWLVKHEVLEKVPLFPEINVHTPEVRIPPVEERDRAIEAITWEARGIFLTAAHHALRSGELRALRVDDWDGELLHVAKAAKGRGPDAEAGSTKNHAEGWIAVGDPELRRWLGERAAQVSTEARLAGEPLFVNPRAINIRRAWTSDSLRREWARACDRAGVPRSTFQVGTRHSSLTGLAQSGMSERLLRAFSRHKSSRSLSHYAKPVVDSGAIVRILRRTP